MRVNGVQLNSFQTNLIKEVMGDIYMTDSRAEAVLAKLSHKYEVNFGALLQVASANFDAKNVEFKRLEAEDLAKA